ncbi:MAG: hypothetical protein SNH57_08840 [Rikenellaceae bacterium]
MRRLWIMCAGLALLGSCTESTELTDEPLVEQEQFEGRTITATITMPQLEDDASTRISSDYGGTDENTWYFTWEDDDASERVYAWYQDSDSSYDAVELAGSNFTDDNTTATFTGSIPESVTSYRIVYVPRGCTTDFGSETFAIDLTEQDGDLSDLFMISDVIPVSDSDSEIFPDLYHLGGFMALELSFEDIPSYWRNVSVESITVEGLNLTGTSPSVSESADYEVTGLSSTSITLDMSTINTGSSGSTSSQAVLEGSVAGSSFGDERSTSTSVDSGIDVDTTMYLYLNILPTTLAAGDSFTVTVRLSNGVNIVKTKTNSSGGYYEFARAEFGALVLDCDCSGSTSTDEIQYVFGSENSSEDSGVITADIDAADTYYIWTERQLLALATWVNSHTGSSYGDHTFELMADVTVDSDKWTSIGGYYESASVYPKFSGVFDGNGYSIKGDGRAVTHTSDTPSISVGVFGYITGENTCVKNLVIDNFAMVMERVGSHVGVLTGSIDGEATILNCGCTASCSVTLSSRGAAGGLAGHAGESYIYNSYNQGSVTGLYDNSGNMNAGGLCGSTYVDSSTVATITNCYNVGSVTSISTSYTFASHNNNAKELVGLASSADVFTYLYCNIDTSDESDESNNLYGGTKPGTFEVYDINNATALKLSATAKLITDAADWVVDDSSYLVHSFSSTTEVTSED